MDKFTETWFSRLHPVARQALTAGKPSGFILDIKPEVKIKGEVINPDDPRHPNYKETAPD